MGTGALLTNPSSLLHLLLSFCVKDQIKKDTLTMGMLTFGRFLSRPYPNHRDGPTIFSFQQKLIMEDSGSRGGCRLTRLGINCNRRYRLVGGRGGTVATYFAQTVAESVVFQ